MSHFQIIAFSFLLCLATGCLPGPSPEKEPVGPISVSQASVRISDRRSDNGMSYGVTLELNGAKFDANWELGSMLKRTSKLQLKKIPVDWSFNEVKSAMQVVLDGRAANPWYRKIDATILAMMDKAHANNERAVAIAADSPYRVAVKVDQHTKEWFVEVNVHIVDEHGNNVGM